MRTISQRITAAAAAHEDSDEDEGEGPKEKENDDERIEELFAKSTTVKRLKADLGEVRGDIKKLDGSLTDSNTAILASLRGLAIKIENGTLAQCAGLFL